MIHYTLNTGHSRESPRSEVGAEAIALLRPWFRGWFSGKSYPLNPGYEAAVFLPVAGGALVSVVRGKLPKQGPASGKGEFVPLVSFAVTLTDSAADQLWPKVEELYHQVTELPGIRSADFAAARRPVKTPWIAAMTIAAEPHEAMWIADFERCAALAFWEEFTSSGN